jgi:hypothetical protein
VGIPEAQTLTGARERATIVVKASFQAETFRLGLDRIVWNRALII